MANAVEKRMLRRAARYWGVQPDYLNFLGEPVKSSSDSIKDILRLLSGVEVKDSNDLNKAVLKRVQEKVLQVMEPVCVQKTENIFLSAFLNHGTALEDIQVFISYENGKAEAVPVELESSNKLYHVGGDSYRKFRIKASQKLPVGYHTISLVVKGQVLAETWVISPPQREHKNAIKKLGVFTPLYAIRSKRNLGIGDLGDLKSLQTLLQKQGVDFVGILPVLAQSYGQEYNEVSPYSAISKLFWNEIYLDLDELAFRYPEMAKLFSGRDRLQISRLQNTSHVDYPAVVPLKESLLLSFSKIFFDLYAEKDKAFVAFRKGKYLLEDYCRFQSQGSQEKFFYHLFVQYQMDRQLKALNHHSKKGFAGIYLDYPVGTSKAGFDSFHFSESFMNKVSVGAPPDLLFRKGQNWGIAPIHPRVQRTEHYRYFIESLRNHMLVADYIRLDHVMALKRLYVIPENRSAREGVYLNYNPDEMFAILAIEAERHQVTIIGENLGTVPESIQRSLCDNFFKGMWVLPFEVGEQPHQAIAKIAAGNLACLNTHDMVPFEGFLQGVDIQKFKDLGIYPGKKARKEFHLREETIKKWCANVDAEDAQDLFFRFCDLLSQSEVELFLLNIEDLWGETEPQNIPGTWHEYPNWTRKLKFFVEEWSQSVEVNNFINRLAQARKQRKEHGFASDLGRHLSV